jgi:hypothetical protein
MAVTEAGDGFSIQRKLARAVVDHDEVISRAVHFGEAKFHGSGEI